MMCVVGCSGPYSRTSIIVQLSLDQPNPRSVSINDVLLVVGETAAQFGLSSDSSQTTYFSSNSEERPRIELNVRYDDFPLVIDISEWNEEFRSERHRNLANALVVNLNKLELNASITFHTPDPVERGWLFYSGIYGGLGSVATLLIWRRSIRVRNLHARFEAAHRSLAEAANTTRT